VETDCYRVEWGRSTVGRSISAKTRRTECKPGGGTRTAPLCGRLRSQSVLTDRQVLEVARLVQHLEETLGCPQDIEWAYADGRLFILQARPIIFPPTSLADEGRIWDNSNIVESYPGLTLPLTFSFVREGYALCFRRAVLGFLLCRREIEGDLHIFDEMIGLLDGRVYYNLLNWYRMMSYLPGYRQYRNSWDRMIGITRALPFPGRRLSLPNRLYALAVVLYRLLAVRRTARRFFRHFQPACRRYQGIDFEKLPAGELLSVYRAMQREFSLRWHLTLYNDFCAIRYFDWLRGLCGRWGLQRFPNLHNDLLCGEGDVESMHAVRSLLSVCALVRREPRFVELFTETSARKIWSRIHAESGFGPLGAALDQHLADFGDRGLEELKLEQPTFRDRPEIVIALLKSYLERGTSADQLTRSEARLRSEAEANARSVLRNPLKWALFTWVLRQARLSVAQRENMRFARSRLFGISRRLFRRLADLFAEQGLLCCREDFYYLTVGEAFGYLQGTAVTQDLQRLVDMRREEYAQFEAHRLPDRLQTAGVPYPVPQAPEATAGLGDGSLWGTGCSGGSVRGTAWIVSDPRAADRAGDYVLIAKSTDPGWAFLMIRARGIVVERGSVLSHTAIIGRELGIPTVVGVPAATDRIQDGRPVSINGRTGEVRCG
jgi:pyruvate,water dikinase